MISLPDPVAEARRIIDAVVARDLPIRVVGGVGVALIAPTIATLQPPRTYHDIDVVAPAGVPAIARSLGDLGYLPAREFNALNGSERLLFHDGGGRRLDVFLDTLRMCHALPFRDRLRIWPETLSPADLLLSKLQIVELTDRDAQDVLALLADHDLTETDATGIDLRRVREVCGGDWGWWRTVDDNLAQLSDRWRVFAPPGGTGPASLLSRAGERAAALRHMLQISPRSMAWRIRAAIGPRLRWYEVPEEVR